jgi:hypothetical protein
LPRLFCQLGIAKPLGDGLNACNYVAAAVDSDAALTPESDSANLLLSKINHMFQTVLLRDHMDHSDTFAAWLHEQFAYEFVTQALHDWQREFKAGQNDGNWRTVIALENGQLLGGAALAKDDSPITQHSDHGLRGFLLHRWQDSVAWPNDSLQRFAPQQKESDIRNCICTHMTGVTITQSEDGSI